MIKYILSILLLLTTTLGVQNLWGQSLQTGEIQKRFEDKVTNMHQEKLYVHTDRSIYVTGETLWLSTYTVDASFNSFSGLSKVVNIEIVNQQGKAMKQNRFKLEDGKGKGQLFISPDIPTGTYVLRAYTNWMKNFKDAFVFHTDITIVNPASAPEQTPTDAVNKINVHFFPEGGDLVTNIKSRVAIKTVDESGQPISTVGVIVDQLENEITKFKTNARGLTSIEITPNSNTSYKAHIAQDSVIRQFNLPKPKQVGVVMTTVPTADGNYQMTIVPSKDYNQTGYLLIHSKGIIERIQTIGLNSQLAISVKGESLQPGISHITLLNDQMEPLVERLIYKFPVSSPWMDTELSQINLARRERVTLKIDLKSRNHHANLDKVSVAVAAADENSNFHEDIESYLYLSSDLSSRIADPRYYLDMKPKDRMQNMDLLMLTHGWRRFDWQDINNDDVPRFKYPAEINAPVLSGRLKPNVKTGNTPNRIQINFSGKSSIVNSLDLEEDGIFHFEIPYRIQNDKVNFFSTRDTISSTQIEIDRPFNLPYRRGKIPQFNFSTKVKSYLERLNTNIQLSQVYRSVSTINGIAPEIKDYKNHFYGEPENLYLLDNYTRFETMRDLFIEYVRSVQVKNKKGDIGFYVYKNNNYLPRKAMTMIDGVPILDPQYILDFDPLKIEKIGIVNNAYHLGGMNFDGIINFTTYRGDFDEQEIPSYIVEKAYKALAYSREFYAPNYVLDKDFLKRIPDYRNTLYWNPDISFDENGQAIIEFYTSDDIGSYQIDINGLSSNGIPFYKKLKINVEQRMP